MTGNSWRAIALGVGLILVGWGVSLYLDQVDSFLALTTAVGTLALVVVTWLYVEQTRTLVSDQRDSFRRTVEMNAVARLADVIIPADQATFDIKGSFPLGAADDPPDPSFLLNAIENVNVFARSLPFFIHELPDPLMEDLDSLALDSMQTVIRIKTFASSIESASLSEETPSPTWGRIKQEYEARLTKMQPEHQLAWDLLASDQWLSDYYSALNGATNAMWAIQSVKYG